MTTSPDAFFIVTNSQLLPVSVRHLEFTSAVNVKHVCREYDGKIYPLLASFATYVKWDTCNRRVNGEYIQLNDMTMCCTPAYR